MANTTLTTDNKAIKTSVIMKLVMAFSGLFFVLFLILHSYGNLKYLSGQSVYNDYALHLRTFMMPILPYQGLLWILRIGLLVLILLHMGSAFHLWHRAGVARGSRYAMKKSLATAYAARTMRWGGIIIALFAVFHLLHFTVRSAKIGDPAAYATHEVMINGSGHVVSDASQAVMTITEGNPYAMMYVSFSNWWMVLAYAIFVGAVALHVAHGVWSALQTIGWLRKNTQTVTQVISGLVGLGIFIMFLIPPLCILAGAVPAPVL